MKLHLPKGLLVAVLAACSVLGGVAEAATGWSSSILYIDTTAGTTGVITDGLTGISAADGVLSITSVDASSKKDVTIYADGSNDVGVPANIGTMTVANGSTISVVKSTWGPRYFDALTIDSFVAGNGTGSANLSVNYTPADSGTQYTNKVIINSVTGVLGSVTVGQGGDLTIGTEGGTTIFGGTITNTGTTTVNGAVSVTNLSNFDITSEGAVSWSDADNSQGFKTVVGTTYTLATGGVTFTATQVNDNGTMRDITTSEDGTSTFVGGSITSTVYYVTNADETAGAAGTEGATGYDVASGRTLSVTSGSAGAALNVSGDGAAQFNESLALGSLSSTVAQLSIGNNATVEVSGAAAISGGIVVAEGSTLSLKGSARGDFILNATGSGTIELDTGTNTAVLIPGYDNSGTGDQGTAAGTNASTFGGVISIKSGTLQLGSSGNDQKYWGLDLSSLKSIDLDGGSMRLFGAASKISTINVNTESTLNVWQASVTQSTETGNSAISGTPGYSIGNLVLNESLTVTTSWRSVVEIGKLTGSGDINWSQPVNGGTLGLYINEVDASAGMNINLTGANVYTTLGKNETSHLTIGGTITNAGGTLAVNGVITIVDSLDGFKVSAVGSGNGELSVNGTDGYMTVSGSSYLLVENTSGSCTFTPTTATLGGETVQLTQDATTGSVTFVGGTTLDTTYRVNTADVTVGGTDATANTARATAFNVTEGRTVTIAGNSDNATASAILADSTGAGNVVLTVDASLDRNQQTQLTGKLTISGAQLNLGDSDLSNDTSGAVGASISSFTSVELDAGTIYIKNPDGTINNLIVTANGGTIDVYDMGQATASKLYTLAGTTTLNGDLNLTSTWNTQLKIEKTAGSGDIVINDTRSEAMVLTIDGKEEGYSGEVRVGSTADLLTLSIAQDAGLDVRYTTRSGNMNLSGIESGNKVIMNGASGSITAGTIAAAVQIENSSNGQYAGMEITSAAAGDALTYTGNISGGGNYVISTDSGTSTTFSGDTSAWSGKMEVIKGTQNVTYSGGSVINNDEIKARGLNAATMNLTIENTASAVTVNSAISNTDDNTVNLTVNAAQGATFSKDVTVKTAALAVGTTAVFNGTTDLGDLTLGAGASVTGSGNLTIGQLVLDLQSYTTDYSRIHTLVSTTGTLSFTGSLEGYTDVTVGNYTATVEQSDNSITLRFEDIVALTTTVTDIEGFEDGVLTLIIDKSITSADQKANITGFGDGVLDRILSMTATDADGIVGITLIDTDDLTSDSIVGNGTDNVGFFGAYYGEGAGVGYQVAYIPEPATATLSLLALAGLAARRRRKA